jgi:hypothetical protein
VDRDVIEMLQDWDKDVKVVQWWDLLVGHRQECK